MITVLLQPSRQRSAPQMARSAIREGGAPIRVHLKKTPRNLRDAGAEWEASAWHSAVGRWSSLALSSISHV